MSVDLNHNGQRGQKRGSDMLRPVSLQKIAFAKAKQRPKDATAREWKAAQARRQDYWMTAVLGAMTTLNALANQLGVKGEVVISVGWPLPALMRWRRHG